MESAASSSGRLPRIANHGQPEGEAFAGLEPLRFALEDSTQERIQPSQSARQWPDVTALADSQVLDESSEQNHGKQEAVRVACPFDNEP